MHKTSLGVFTTETQCRPQGTTLSTRDNTHGHGDNTDRDGRTKSCVRAKKKSALPSKQNMQANQGTKRSIHLKFVIQTTVSGLPTRLPPLSNDDGPLGEVDPGDRVAVPLGEWVPSGAPGQRRA